MDLGHYDIANYLGHKSLESLYRVFRVYSVPVSTALRENGISVMSIDFKDEQDIHIESQSKYIKDINVSSVDPINAFHFAGYLENLRRREAEHCIDTAIYFQAMMEADINDVLGKKAKGSFKEKWEGFLASNNAPQEIHDSFTKYHDIIYKKIRIPSVHAKHRKGLTNIESLRFPSVHKGIKSGWFCFVFLLGVVHEADMNPQENWRVMSEEAHGVPASIDENEYPDYSKTIAKLYDVHLSHFNNKS